MGINDLLKDLNRQKATARTPARQTPHVIQIGFDWGTSNSKCVYRDLSKNRAFVYTYRYNNTDRFLVSSTIVFRDNTFSLNTSPSQYPAHGLWNLKLALAAISRGDSTSPALARFNQLAHLTPGTEEQKRFVRACAVFYLSRTLQHIRFAIMEKYGDFGSHPGDEMYVTMAIPVRDISATATKQVFNDVLGQAWALACQERRLESSIARSQMEREASHVRVPQDLVYHVYPEVSANIQALRNSPNVSLNDTRIYLFTDVGSGTVDQCCFTFSSRKRRKGERNNFLAAQVIPLGSGVIEQVCHKRSPATSLETWQRYKEQGLFNKLLHNVIVHLEPRLGEIFMSSTLRELQNHLYDNESVCSADSMRRNLHVVFGGGGNMRMPYQSAVLKTLGAFLHLPTNSIGRKYGTWADRVIHLTMPEDIVLTAQQQMWMKRLYVAYGLSFLYEDLPSCLVPQETALHKKNPLRVLQPAARKAASLHRPQEHREEVCPFCRGQNPNCLHCDGKDVV